MAGNDKALYLIVGDDEYKVSSAARECVDQICPAEDQTLSLEMVDGAVDNAAEAVAAINRCLAGLRTIGLLGGQRVIWLKDANFFSDTQTGKAADTKAHVGLLVQEIKNGFGPGQALVISSPKVDKRSALYKACKAVGEISEYRVPEKAYQAEEYAQEQAERFFREEGVSIEDDALMLLVERAGVNTRQILLESEKLLLYVGRESSITREDVQAIVSTSRELLAWDLAGALGRRDVQSALRIIGQLSAQNKSAVGLLIALQGNFRVLQVLRECMDRGWVSIARRGTWRQAEWTENVDAEACLSLLDKDPRTMHPFRTIKLMEQAQQYSARDLLRCRNRIVETHEQLVSSQVPPRLVLEFLALELCKKATGSISQG